MRLGILGGTFDPPHDGHLKFAKAAIEQLGLDKILFMLTPNPPHKEGNRITELDLRIKMVNSVIYANDRYELCEIDINRNPPHYTFESVRLLKLQYPDDEIIFLMGGDSLMDLPDVWELPQQFVDNCDGLGVFKRDGFKVDMVELEQQLRGITAKTDFLNLPQIEVSSTHIRDQVKAGELITEYVSDEVSKIIDRNRIYLDERKN